MGSLKERRDALSLKNCPLNLLPGSPPTRCNQITTFQDNSILVLSCCAGKLISVYSVFARLANRIQAIRPPPNTILYSYSHSYSPQEALYVTFRCYRSSAHFLNFHPAQRHKVIILAPNQYQMINAIFPFFAGIGINIFIFLEDMLVLEF